MFDAPITTIEQAKESYQGMGYHYVLTYCCPLKITNSRSPPVASGENPARKT